MIVIHVTLCNFHDYNKLTGTLVYGSVALLVARRTNDRKVAGSRPAKVVSITVLTGNRMGVNCSLWPAATSSSELYEFRLSPLMDLDLTWVNGKSGR